MPQEPSELVDTPPDRYWDEWSGRAAEAASPGWPGMIDELRALQDAVAGSLPPGDTVAEVTELLARSRRLLKAHRAPSEDQIFGRLLELPGRGQTLTPQVCFDGVEGAEVRATTRFGLFHVGHNSAAHGGAIALMFDEVLGRAASLAGPERSRTAYLHVDFRSVTPVERPVQVRAWLTEHTGRKRYVRGALSDGERLCANAEGLFMTVRPGQQ